MNNTIINIPKDNELYGPLKKAHEDGYPLKIILPTGEELIAVPQEKENDSDS